MSDSKVLGVVVLSRHGDRQGFYQDAATYTPTQTVVTALGVTQGFQLGSLLRSLYVDASSPSHIQGLSTGEVDLKQIDIRADAGGEASVILNTALALTQGMWPATNSYNTTLANGTTISSPLGGYQYVPTETVEPDENISLEGFTQCPALTAATADFYKSDLFADKEAESQAFLDQLPPFMDGRPVALKNMWNVFDYMNVQSIHNAQFFQALPPTFLAQARHLANWHAYNTFASPKLDGIENIAGTTILPVFLDAFARIVDQKDPLSFVYIAASYKPFLSLFNITGVVEAQPQLAGFVNYTSAIAFEVRQPSQGEPVLRLNFKNGSDPFMNLNYLQRTGDVPLSAFVAAMVPLAINTTAEWCKVCGNTQDRGCAEIGSGYLHLSQPVSPLGAGFIGAAVTLVVMGAVMLASFGLIKWKGNGKKEAKA